VLFLLPPRKFAYQQENSFSAGAVRNVSLENWNKFYHDHAVEIATGRVQVLDRSPEEAKKIAAAAAQTDDIIFHLWWPDDGKALNGPSSTRSP